MLIGPIPIGGQRSKYRLDFVTPAFERSKQLGGQSRECHSPVRRMEELDQLLPDLTRHPDS